MKKCGLIGLRKYGLSDSSAVQRHFSSPGIDLLEVYCDQESQLTKQAAGQGLAAARFGLRQGDLSTTKGRFALYDMLWSLRPKHIWCAPKCSPWCSWSRLNRNKSIALADKIDASRRDENVHLLLCDALLRLQVWRSVESHFHLEQPQGSELIFQHEMTNIVQSTFRALCDMCTAGKLQHPETHDMIRKRTQILTTSEIMYRALERLQCPHNHVHAQILGSCHPPGKHRMPLSQYTELYTATFGRKLSRAILCSVQAKERQCVPDLSEVSGECVHAIICAVRAEVPGKSTPEPEAKRRRLGGKSSP